MTSRLACVRWMCSTSITTRKQQASSAKQTIQQPAASVCGPHARQGPQYLDESWINETVQLIPRMKVWIDKYYPGTKLAIGEWSWGGEKSMSGALAIADVLGICGREGVDMASYWTFPPVHTPAAQAFAMFTHYND